MQLFSCQLGSQHHIYQTKQETYDYYQYNRECKNALIPCMRVQLVSIQSHDNWGELFLISKAIHCHVLPSLGFSFEGIKVSRQNFGYLVTALGYGRKQPHFGRIYIP